MDERVGHGGTLQHGPLSARQLAQTDGRKRHPHDGQEVWIALLYATHAVQVVEREGLCTALGRSGLLAGLGLMPVPSAG